MAMKPRVTAEPSRAGTLAPMKPLLLTDLDGVINVFPVGVTDLDAWELGIGITFTFQGMTFRIPDGVSERLLRLGEVYDFVWASGWERDAASIIGPHLGIGGDWPVIPLVDRGKAATWKLKPVRRWLEAQADGRAVAWMDDEFGMDAEEWAASRGQTWLVRTELDEGLTEEQTLRLLEWARALPETEA
jgi:hypothetical protein